MGNLVAFEWLSADGVFDASNMNQWWDPYNTKSRMACIAQTYAQADAFLFGRTTFDMLEPSFSQMPDDALDGVAGTLTHTPKFVVTSSPVENSWGSVTKLSLEDKAALEALKEQHRHIVLIGSAVLAEELSLRGLIDEYKLLINPKVVGTGDRFFRGSTNATLELVETKTLEMGVLFVHYRVRKEP